MSIVKKVVCASFGLMVLLVTTVQGQQQGIDSAILTLDDFLDIVKTNHPIAIQANLQPQKGEATVRQARGGFDPKAMADVSEKYFKDYTYYSKNNVGLKVPTWFGIEAKAGYEENNGYYLNPENSTSGAGLWYAGVSVPVGKGLFIDSRRAELRQAQIYQQSSEAERRVMLNDLQYEAGKAYWEWFKFYHNLKVYEEGLKLATERLNAVKQSVKFGDKPAIDTLEASIQVQNRQISLQQARLDFVNSTALLSIYLWAEGVVPLEVDNYTIPSDLSEIKAVDVDLNYRDQLNDMVVAHPKLQLYEYKIADLGIQQRLKRESLKPELNLSYNALNKAVGSDPTGGYSMNNYKWGLEFSFPIFLRKERGALQLADLKIKEAQLSFTQQNAQLVYKASAALNTWDNTFDQANTYEQTVENYNQLLTGERRKYQAGESSLFLVNYREMSYINAKIKWVELISKNRKAKVEAQYSLGILDVSGNE
ncbi:TolC family protein [Fulvivirga sediminis]|uniref:TolC family protein n=1 Tax=Fulvivirga sediminis TaxID=2803949 RepID=A0A937F3X9_9BACT|nr:TolC family protein [Fulvivirga sediminis]MBL3655896.1 TolC family protein [Fulvivirga sediminis]